MTGHRVQKDQSRTNQIRLRMLPGRYAVAQLAPDAPLPDWFDGPGFTAMARAEDELTLICLEDRVPDNITAERGWSCLRSVGPFAFDAAGIVRDLVTPLSDNGIGVFVCCTFDGEHLLLPSAQEQQARAQLSAAGHVFVP